MADSDNESNDGQSAALLVVVHSASSLGFTSDFHDDLAVFRSTLNQGEFSAKNHFTSHLIDFIDPSFNYSDSSKTWRIENERSIYLVIDLCCSVLKSNFPMASPDLIRVAEIELSLDDSALRLRRKVLDTSIKQPSQGVRWKLVWFHIQSPK